MVWLRLRGDAFRGRGSTNLHKASVSRKGVAEASQAQAYTIVCLMVGSDPAAFAELARRAKLPQERQETCQGDFEQAKSSWLHLLEAHFRASPRPSFWERLISPRGRLLARPDSSVAVEYGEAPAELAPYRDLLRTVKLLEEVRDFASKNFTFPRSIMIEAKTCGEPNAYWDPVTRRVVLCYEFLAFHASLALRP